jgi:hypothetical protein
LPDFAHLKNLKGSTGVDNQKIEMYFFLDSQLGNNLIQSRLAVMNGDCPAEVMELKAQAYPHNAALARNLK